MRRKQAFTLAEVLLVLSVIGVVAALTIPTLIQKISDDQYKSAFKKAYSTASQSINMTISQGNTFNTFTDRWTAFKSNLNTIKTCTGTTLGNCLPTAGYASTNITTAAESSECAKLDTSANQTATEAVVLADGAVWFRENATMTAGGTTPFVVGIDVNGVKPPNIWGKDVFSLKIDSNGVVAPAACDSTNNSQTYLYQ